MTDKQTSRDIKLYGETVTGKCIDDALAWTYGLKDIGFIADDLSMYFAGKGVKNNHRCADRCLKKWKRQMKVYYHKPDVCWHINEEFFND